MFCVGNPTTPNGMLPLILNSPVRPSCRACLGLENPRGQKLEGRNEPQFTAGSAQTDARQRESLNPFAEQLREFIENRAGSRLTLGEAAAWLKSGGRKAQFEAAMRGVRSFSAFLKLFPEIFELDIPAAGGTTRVRLV